MLNYPNYLISPFYALGAGAPSVALPVFDRQSQHGQIMPYLVELQTLHSYYVFGFMVWLFETKPCACNNAVLGYVGILTPNLPTIAMSILA